MHFLQRGRIMLSTHSSPSTLMLLHWIVSFLYVYRWVVHVSWGFVSRFAHSHKNCMHAAGLIFCCPILHYYIPSNWTTSIDLNQPGYYIYKYWWGYDLVAAGNLQASKQACCCTMHWWEIRWKVWNSLVLVQESGNLKRPFYLADSNERRHPKK